MAEEQMKDRILHISQIQFSLPNADYCPFRIKLTERSDFVQVLSTNKVPVYDLLGAGANIHSFIQAISIAPLQVHYYSEEPPTQPKYCAGISRRSAKGNCE